MSDFAPAVRTCLHVGCGPARSQSLPTFLSTPGWREIRVDIDPLVQPDIVASITDLSKVPSCSVDAVFSAHNLEHIYAHEVPQALSEFLRVLKPGGMFVFQVPDLQRVAELVAADRLEDRAYDSLAGPISPLDMIYGHGASVAAGSAMAHRTGFTLNTLRRALLRAAGFESPHLERHEFDLCGRAVKAAHNFGPGGSQVFA